MGMYCYFFKNYCIQWPVGFEFVIQCMYQIIKFLSLREPQKVENGGEYLFFAELGAFCVNFLFNPV